MTCEFNENQGVWLQRKICHFIIKMNISGCAIVEPEIKLYEYSENKVVLIQRRIILPEKISGCTIVNFWKKIFFEYE